MNRFFKAAQSAYESIRNQMDNESGFPSREAQTWFTPYGLAPKDSSGKAYIASEGVIADRFASKFFGVDEITSEQYHDLINSLSVGNE
jgi:hypothetical protein